jgi:hypothetical protein
MPYIDMDIDVEDFLYACSRRDIKELIQSLVENDHLPKEVFNKNGDVKEDLVRRGRGEDDFSDKLEQLKTKYYSLTQEEEEFFDRVFKKYL